MSKHNTMSKSEIAMKRSTGKQLKALVKAKGPYHKLAKAEIQRRKGNKTKVKKAQVAKATARFSRFNSDPEVRIMETPEQARDEVQWAFHRGGFFSISGENPCKVHCWVKPSKRSKDAPMPESVRSERNAGEIQYAGGVKAIAHREDQGTFADILADTITG